VKLLFTVIVALTSCTGTEEVLDEGAGLVGSHVGHYWDCDMTIQFGYPTPVLVSHFHSRPCLEPGDGSISAYENAFIQGTCWPAIDEANALKLAPGGGYCGGGCDAENWDLCTPQDEGYQLEGGSDDTTHALDAPHPLGLR
jgi:hypothetical protein